MGPLLSGEKFKIVFYDHTRVNGGNNNEYSDYAGFPSQYIFYIIKLFADIYMSAITGKTAGPNGLTFFKRTQKYPGGNIGSKKFNKVFL